MATVDLATFLCHFATFNINMYQCMQYKENRCLNPFKQFIKCFATIERKKTTIEKRDVKLAESSIQIKKKENEGKLYFNADNSVFYQKLQK